MATRFNPEQVREMRRAAGIDDTAEIPRFVDTKPIVPEEAPLSPQQNDAGALRRDDNVRAIRLGEIRRAIAASDVPRVPGIGDAQELDVTELRRMVGQIDEEADRRAAGLSGGIIDRLKNLFRKK